MVGRAYCSRILIIFSHCFLDKFTAGNGYVKVHRIVEFSAIHVSCCDRHSAFICATHSFAFFCIAKVDGSLFSAGKAPRLSASRSAGIHFSSFLFPHRYQGVKSTKHQWVFSGLMAPKVADKAASQVSTSFCSSFMTSLLVLSKDSTWIRSVSLMKAYHTK